jgi:hypothetical protein
MDDVRSGAGIDRPFRIGIVTEIDNATVIETLHQ